MLDRINYLALALLVTVIPVCANEPLMRCRYTDQPLPYFCRPTEKFWGVAVGMSNQEAFRGLCKSVPLAVWSAGGTLESKGPHVEGLSCSQWGNFANSKVWVLRASGYPCEQDAYAVILTDSGKVVKYTVMCKNLRDRSLLKMEGY
jgi:hypothetical protein